MSKHYNFGVEIETVVRPYGGHKTFSQVEWYRQLAEKLQNRNIPATHDDLQHYSKHPEYYSGKWFVTRDGSLRREAPYVCMEVVSPILTTLQRVTDTISEFWEAVGVHFDVQRDNSCGGHVHVTPMRSTSKFTLAELKKLAFAVVVYEDHVRSVLPEPRRENAYCCPNTRSANNRGETCRLSALARAGKTTQSLRLVQAELAALTSERALCTFMQKNRYVLWNFQNIVPNAAGKCSGTVEFRGGSQFLTTKGTLSWVAFVLGFITLALEEDLLKNFTSYSPPSSTDMASWWKRIRNSAKQSKLSRHLPDDYQTMQKK